jgi:hypothetical protein
LSVVREEELSVVGGSAVCQWMNVLGLGKIKVKSPTPPKEGGMGHPVKKLPVVGEEQLSVGGCRGRAKQKPHPAKQQLSVAGCQLSVRPVLSVGGGRGSVKNS